MRHIGNLAIRTKLIAAFAIIIAIVAGTGYVTSSGIRTIQTMEGWNTHTYQVIDILSGAFADVVNQETGVRGYLISASAGAGDEGDLDP